MTIQNNPLDDNLDDIFGAFERAPLPADAAPRFEVQAHVEPCRKCHGRGRFISYSGRDLGECFSCKGAGKKAFKQSADKREAARTSAANRKDAKANDWHDAHPVESAWLNAASKRGFRIASELLDAVHKYGSLYDSKLALIHRFIAQDAQRADDAAKRQVEAKAVEISKVALALATALGNGLKNPKLRLDSFVFSLAKAHSANAGSIYVKSGETYLGKIAEGRFIRARDCSREQEARILVVAADPGVWAVAYGNLTGSCACCGRELTDPVSVARGIGPVCAEKFGF